MLTLDCIKSLCFNFNHQNLYKANFSQKIKSGLLLKLLVAPPTSLEV